MNELNAFGQPEQLLRALSADCSQCCGLCCVALYFAKTDGFPSNKPAGVPCQYLNKAFRCNIHSDLAQRGFKGCIAYDCFGAGQLIAAQGGKEMDWQAMPKQDRNRMLQAFYTLCSLNQMLWYLAQAAQRQEAASLRPALMEQVEALLCIVSGEPEGLQTVNLDKIRSAVNPLLKRAAIRVREAAYGGPARALPRDLAGKRLQGRLVGADLSMALLIGANLHGANLHAACLLGADLRDCNLSGADLSGCLFLTQGQVSSARGDKSTRLPAEICRPTHWM